MRETRGRSTRRKETYQGLGHVLHPSGVRIILKEAMYHKENWFGGIDHIGLGSFIPLKRIALPLGSSLIVDVHDKTGRDFAQTHGRIVGKADFLGRLDGVQDVGNLDRVTLVRILIVTQWVRLVIPRIVIKRAQCAKFDHLSG